MRDIMTLKNNKWLATHMRQHSINPNERTQGMYVPDNGRIDDMPVEYLKRNLCHKAQGNAQACMECETPCMIGKALKKAVTTP